jgi:hypothetical protein
MSRGSRRDDFVPFHRGLPVRVRSTPISGELGYAGTTGVLDEDQKVGQTRIRVRLASGAVREFSVFELEAAEA